MQFFNLLLIPALVSAAPQLSARQDETPADVPKYSLAVPADYVSQHPEVPDTLVLDQAQLDKVSSFVPIDVNDKGEITVNGEIDIEKIANADKTGEMSVQTNAQCATCIAGCVIAGALGPEGVLVCIAFCTTRSFCRR